MINKSRTLLFVATVILGLSGSTVSLAADPAAAAKPVPTSNGWRIELDGRAAADGEIVLAIIQGEVTTTVTTRVAKGESENQVARLIRDQVKAQAPARMFKAETDDGEDVLIKRKSGTSNFGLQLVSTSVTGLEIKIEKE
jgi:acetylornithine deacetylase/succinyl-diaminopimelate desuccinylase-like protein